MRFNVVPEGNMSSRPRVGPPKHANKYAWKPNAGVKINETEVGGRFRPLSEITGVCPKCRDQIEWKRKYGKYKPLSEPAKCQKCTKRAVRQAYHNLCNACAREHNVCAKCSCRVERIVGRDATEVEAEQKMLQAVCVYFHFLFTFVLVISGVAFEVDKIWVLFQAISNAREREKRSLLRAMNKGKSQTKEQDPTDNPKKAGDLFKAESLEAFADTTRDDEEEDGSDHETQVVN
ncbi:Protein of unknown function DUF2039 [Cynara cardunculus var. scolymus]|uniref:Uncharacterized protein n=1 Tax=Cynara cardunculus var. scolymus TaxID=59895 RepID=A0A103XKZ1_CYNCS|nr:Protein of unknown function DUF2039 [Cynara cardunculus var. scolymus]